MKRKQKMLQRERAYRKALREAELEILAVYVLIFRARGNVGYAPGIDWTEMPVLT